MRGAWQQYLFPPGQSLPTITQQRQRQLGMRRSDFVPMSNLGTQRSNEVVRGSDNLDSFDEIRMAFEACDYAKLAFRLKQKELYTLNFTIGPRSGNARDAILLENEINEVQNIFAKPDGFTYWGDWLSLAYADTYIYDALSVEILRDFDGNCAGFRLIDGSTIYPLRDPIGETPAYNQIIKGNVFARYRRPDVDPSILPFDVDGELIYRPRWTTLDTPYGCPPVQQIPNVFATLIALDLFEKSYYTDGNINGLIFGVSADVDQQTLTDIQNDMDAMGGGDNVWRNLMHFVSLTADGKIKDNIYEPRKFNSDQAHRGELRKAIFAAYGLNESQAGWAEHSGKMSNEGQEDVKERDEKTYTNWMLDMLNDFIQSPRFLNHPNLKGSFKYDTREDAFTQAQTYQILKAMPDDGTGPVIFNSEVRQVMVPELDPVDLDDLEKLTEKKAERDTKLAPPVQAVSGVPTVPAPAAIPPPTNGHKPEPAISGGAKNG